jgi:hypothetical protein
MQNSGAIRAARSPSRILSSLRGANGSRGCAPDDRLRDEAIQLPSQCGNGLLRFARNDGWASEQRKRAFAARHWLQIGHEIGVIPALPPQRSACNVTRARTPRGAIQA